jgi:hypothetical protein
LNIVLISCKPALSFISVCSQSISCTCQANGRSYSPLWFMFFYRLRFFWNSLWRVTDPCTARHHLTCSCLPGYEQG